MKVQCLSVKATHPLSTWSMPDLRFARAIVSPIMFHTVAPARKQRTRSWFRNISNIIFPHFLNGKLWSQRNHPRDWLRSNTLVDFNMLPQTLATQRKTSCPTKKERKRKRKYKLERKGKRKVKTKEKEKERKKCWEFGLGLYMRWRVGIASWLIRVWRDVGLFLTRKYACNAPTPLN